jgi:translation initiation factor 5B
MSKTRSPICSVLGHVDHGKSSILDKIRGSAIVKGEAGAITQAIGASIVPIDTIKKVCGSLLNATNTSLTIPGLLFIDTPGHEAFTTLRKRGGNLADIAILVVSIMEGLKPQTIEALEILKTYKTPFIIAANKIDLIQGWQRKDNLVIKNASLQDPKVNGDFETKIYELIGKIHEVIGKDAERFDRVEDYTKQIAIIPTSAETGEGIPELLMVITGLAQKYLENCLKCDAEGPAKGTILEVKEEKGLGKTVDVIIFDGHLKVNDTIVIGTMNEPIVTKVRALLEPKPLSEIRDKKAKFNSVKEVFASTGVKISAPNLDDAVAGMPIRATEDSEKAVEEIKEEIENVIVETDKQGIVVKADSLGSLEAMLKLLKDKEIPVKKASIGNITKKDMADAESSYEKDPLLSVILGFNVKDESGLCKDTVNIITDNVIYKIIEEYERWTKEKLQNMQQKELEGLIKPCKIELMKGYMFRQSNPAISGTSIEEGTLETGTPLMKKDGNTITRVKAIQAEQKNIEKAEKNKQVAVSYENVTFGRQINEGDILYSAIPEEDFRKYKELKKLLAPEEKELLKTIAKIMRDRNPVWGI